MKRDHWQRRIEQLDPGVEFVEIYRIMAGHEFPWDMTQSLGLALYRTYAEPSIGELLAQTGEFERRTHKRYADYPDPGAVTRALTVAGLRARAAIERRLPPRRRPRHVPELRQFAIYPQGYTVDQLGTFPAGDA